MAKRGERRMWRMRYTWDQGGSFVAGVSGGTAHHSLADASVAAAVQGARLGPAGERCTTKVQVRTDDGTWLDMPDADTVARLGVELFGEGHGDLFDGTPEAHDSLVTIAGQAQLERRQAAHQAIAEKHRTYVDPAQGFGPMAGYRWRCVCGGKGKAVHGRRHAVAGSLDHLDRAAKRAGKL